MAVRRCAWCGKTLGVTPAVAGAETHGICDACQARLVADNALAHAIHAVRAIGAELERARAGIWPPGSPLREP